MIKSIMVAASENNVIGKDGELPWHLPADLKYFKKVTSGHHVIMGRKTYESLGKPLPNRTNIIITRQKDYQPNGYSGSEVIVKHSLESALTAAEERGEQEAMIIGGGDIFRQSMDVVDKIYITRIYEEFEGDTFFPEIDEDKWEELKNDHHEADEKNKFPYSFKVYVKR